MAERSIRSNPESNPLGGCVQRIDCECTAMANQDLADRALYLKWLQYFRCCLADRHCPLTGLPCSNCTA